MTHIRGHRLCFDRWQRARQSGLGLRRCAAAVQAIGAQRERRLGVPGRRRPAGRQLLLGSARRPSRVPDRRHPWRLPLRRALRFQRAQPGRRRRLLPEEHPRRPAAQRRGRVPGAGDVAPQPRRALPRGRHAPGRGGHAGGGRRVPARRTARGGARRARSGAGGRGRGLTAAADALRDRSRRSPEVPRHPRRRRRAGRGTELPGSPEAVDPVERHDRVAGLDGHRRPVHDVGVDLAARPAVLRRPRARAAGSLRHHHRLARAAALTRRDPAVVRRSRRGRR